jgi:hypothetical protein
MAADWQKETKTFSVADGKNGTKENVWWPVYGRLRTVDKNRTATDSRSWLSGLWSRKDDYVWAGQHEGRDVYRRTQKTSFNGFRTKTATYHPTQGKSSEERRYPLGFRFGHTYDVEGQMLSRSYSDVFGSVKESRTPDGRKLTFEQSDLGTWHRKRQEAVGLPDGRAVRWRTMERHLGSYSMEIEPDKNGETKTLSFGKLLGKGWLFEGKTHYDFDGNGETTSRKFGRLKFGGRERYLFERGTHYNFEKRTKDTSYSVLFGIRRQTKEGVPLSEGDIKKALKKASINKHVVRSAENAEADKAWSVHAAGGRPGASRNPATPFKAGLDQFGAARASVDNWLSDVKYAVQRSKGAGRASTTSYAASAPRSDTVAFGESATEPGIEGGGTSGSRGATLTANDRIAALTGGVPMMQQKPPRKPGSRASEADNFSIASGATGFSLSESAEASKAMQESGLPGMARSEAGRPTSASEKPRKPAQGIGSRVGEADNVSVASSGGGFSPSEHAAVRDAMRSLNMPTAAHSGADKSQQKGQRRLDDRGARSRASSAVSI